MAFFFHYKLILSPNYFFKLVRLLGSPVLAGLRVFNKLAATSEQDLLITSYTIYLGTSLSTSDCFETLVTAAMYFMIIFDASVFPAPLSPEKKEKIQQNTQL